MHSRGEHRNSQGPTTRCRRPRTFEGTSRYWKCDHSTVCSIPQAYRRIQPGVGHNNSGCLTRRDGGKSRQRAGSRSGTHPYVLVLLRKPVRATETNLVRVLALAFQFGRGWGVGREQIVIDDVQPKLDDVRVLQRAREQYGERFPLVAYPTKSDGWWLLHDGAVAELAEAYPGGDVEAQCRMAYAWLAANPERQKTARGMRRFLAGWLSRHTNEKGGRHDGEVRGRYHDQR